MAGKNCAGRKYMTNRHKVKKEREGGIKDRKRKGLEKEKKM